MIPSHVSLLIPLIPSSSNVGVSGRNIERDSLATASARNLPDLMCGNVAFTDDIDAITWPPSKPSTEGPDPL